MSAAPRTENPPETVTLTEIQILEIMVGEMCLSHTDVEHFWFLAKREIARQNSAAAQK